MVGEGGGSWHGWLERYFNTYQRACMSSRLSTNLQPASALPCLDCCLLCQASPSCRARLLTIARPPHSCPCLLRASNFLSFFSGSAPISDLTSEHHHHPSPVGIGPATTDHPAPIRPLHLCLLARNHMRTASRPLCCSLHWPRRLQLIRTCPPTTASTIYLRSAVVLQR